MMKPVDVDVLSALLRRRAEMPNLDFKSTWNPDDKRDVVELSKDVAAMESLAEGGYIVIGANDDGSPSGSFLPERPSDFDEQKVRSKIVKYLGEPLELSASLLRWEDEPYLLIGIGPHPEGMRIMSKDAGHAGGEVWRESDVFVRRGTSSVRWNQHEARAATERIVAVRKEEWRKDILETIKQGTVNLDSFGYVNLTADIPVSSLAVATTELIRRNDAVGIDVLTRRTTSAALAIVSRAKRGDVDEAAAGIELNQEFQRLNIIASLSARYAHDAAFDSVLEGYRTIYGANDEESMAYPRAFVASYRLVMTNAMALGAVLVNGKRWRQIDQLALLTPIHTHNGYWKSLLRKAEVMIARSSQGALLDIDERRTGTITDATPVAIQLFETLGELPSQDVVTLMTQFDVFRGIATTDPQTGEPGAYPNFAFYESERSEPAFLALLDYPEASTAFGVKSDAALRSTYRVLDEFARREGMRYHGWHGFRNPRLVAFVEAN